MSLNCCSCCTRQVLFVPPVRKKKRDPGTYYDYRCRRNSLRSCGRLWKYKRGIHDVIRCLNDINRTSMACWNCLLSVSESCYDGERGSLDSLSPLEWTNVQPRREKRRAVIMTPSSSLSFCFSLFFLIAMELQFPS